MQLSSERPRLPQSETAVPPAISVRSGLDRHTGRFDKIFLSILAISTAAISLSFLLFRYDLIRASNLHLQLERLRLA